MLVLIQARLLIKKFDAVLKSPYRYQLRILLKKCVRSVHSDFGKAHFFSSIKTVEDFRNRVPIQSYDMLKPYVDRVVAGDTCALFNSSEKILMFALTSGTTHTCKHIPVTRAFLNEYKRSSLLWGFNLVSDHDFMNHKILALVSPFDEAYTENGIPCGSISGLVVATQKYVARRLYVLPYWVYAIEDQTVKYYTLLRIALAEPDIGLISTANPSTLIKIAQLCNQYRDQLIQDIRTGTLSVPISLTRNQRRSIRHVFRPDPARAEFLHRHVCLHGVLYPRHAWQDMQVIATWKGGVLGHYIDLLPTYYGSVPVRDLGLIASEGRMSIPVSSQGSEGILDITGQFFEFIPEEEYDNPVRRTLLCHELEMGKKYYLIITNSAGFFRYDINDLIEVTGFRHNTPLITFLNKGKHIASLTGEKLSEHQIVTAVHDTVKQLGIELHYYTVSPSWSKTPAYVVMLEQEPWMQSIGLNKFIDVFDAALKQRNIEYRAKRDSGRLDKPQIAVIENGTFERIKHERIQSNNGRSEQYKHVYLNPKIDYHKEFRVLKHITA